MIHMLVHLLMVLSFPFFLSLSFGFLGLGVEEVRGEAAEVAGAAVEAGREGALRLQLPAYPYGGRAAATL